MPRQPVNLHCSTQDRAQLETWRRGQAQEARLVLRAKIIIQGLDGLTGKEIAANLGVRPNTVSQWLRRFSEKGIAALHDRPRPGKPRQYDLDFRNKILTVLEQTPPSGQAQWDGVAVARELGASPDAVWRVLRKEGICLQRQRSWCVSTDPEFTAKAADIIGLYLNPPENALVLSLDEKPSIQALERATGYVKTSSGKIARGYKSTYKRHGTLNLFAALEVATGAIHAKTTTLKRRVEFLEFMDEVVNDLPPEREIHVILDDICFVPVSTLNALRRGALEELDKLRITNYELRMEHSEVLKNDVPYPEKELSYLGNVLNTHAEAFYKRHGVTKIEPAAESGIPMQGRKVMTTRYCIKQQLNLCPKTGAPQNLTEPLSLIDEDGNILDLRFDCAKCQMEIYLGGKR